MNQLLRRFLFPTLPVLVAGLLLAGLVGGCGRSSSHVKKAAVAKPRSENVFKPALELLRQANQLSHFKDALQLLNAHLDKPEVAALIQLKDEQRDFLVKQVRLNQQELEEVEAGVFRPLDAHHMDSSYLFRDAARSLEIKGLSTLQQALLAFDWVTRRVYLHEQGDSGLPPALTLRRGYAGPRDRALVFLALLRQLQLEGCLLSAEDPSAATAAVLVGVAAGKEAGVYLFDPRLGIAVPGPGKEGIATFADVRARPELVKAIGMDPALVPKLQAYVGCPLLALAPRMSYLQAILGAQDRIDLYLDLRQLHEDLTAALGCPVHIWHSPSDKEFSPFRAAQLVLPPEEGGIDRTGRWKRAMVHLIPWPTIVSQLQQMKMYSDIPDEARKVLIERIGELFTAFYLQPEEFFLRGQFDSTLKRIDRIRTPLEQEDFVGADKKQNEAVIADFRKRLIDAYTAFVVRQDPDAQGKLNALWNEDQYLLVLLQVDGEAPPLNRAEKKALSAVVLTASREALGEQVSYLSASCWQEKAALYQGHVELLRTGGQDFKAVLQRAHEAWSTAASEWNKYLYRYRLRPSGIAARLKNLRELWERGEIEMAVGRWQLLHQEIHGSLEAQVRLGKSQSYLDDGKAAALHYQGVLEDIDMLQNSEIAKDLKDCLGKIRDLPQRSLATQLELLSRDWGPQGHLASLQEMVRRRLELLK